MAMFVLIFCAARRLLAASDPYEPLKLYDGAWDVKMSSAAGKIDRLVNHCAKTGLFFSCEQELNGKSVALIVFLPTNPLDDGTLSYHNLALTTDASKPKDWGQLWIKGDTWTYSWAQKDGEKTVPWRNTNHFEGKDHIHFELQSMEDGLTWKTQLSGDEQRVKLQRSLAPCLAKENARLSIWHRRAYFRGLTLEFFTCDWQFPPPVSILYSLGRAALSLSLRVRPGPIRWLVALRSPFPMLVVKVAGRPQGWDVCGPRYLLAFVLVPRHRISMQNLTNRPLQASFVSFLNSPL
jgi:hypothetical protein